MPPTAAQFVTYRNRVPKHRGRTPMQIKKAKKAHVSVIPSKARKLKAARRSSSQRVAVVARRHGIKPKTAQRVSKAETSAPELRACRGSALRRAIYELRSLRAFGGHADRPKRVSYPEFAAFVFEPGKRSRKPKWQRLGFPSLAAIPGRSAFFELVKKLQLKTERVHVKKMLKNNG